MTEVLSVSQLSFQLKRHVETNFSHIEIRGEIASFKRHTSGHAYFSLKDKDALLEAVCWRGTPLDIQLEEGLEIIASGRITTYPARSKYQMVVSKARAAGEGALLKLLLERKEQLRKEGLFDHKKPLPPFPEKIGLITSETGAVLQDILHRLEDRYPCHVLLWPVLVQGPGAAEQIAAAIVGMNKRDVKPDVLIVARGGGSFEDLWAFNEEVVVRAAAASTIPLISAVGHETDTTLIDFAADLRAPTPTAAAELATPVYKQIRQDILQHHRTLFSYLHQKISLSLQKLHRYTHALPDPHHIMGYLVQRLDEYCERLQAGIFIFIRYKTQTLMALKRHIRPPEKDITQKNEHLKSCYLRLQRASQNSLQTYNKNFSLLSIRLEDNSYQKTLQRGFCVLSDKEGKTITSIYQNFSVGKITVQDGVIFVEKKDIRPSI